MNRIARFLALAPFLLAATAAPAKADEPVSTVWKSRGTPAFYAALAKAKASKKWVLAALPGGDGCCGDVFIDKGPIAASLEKEPFLSLAASFETVLIEPPEVELTARAYGVERPGLLLVDADGRWLAAATLPATGGANLAKEVYDILAAPKQSRPRTASLTVSGPAGSAAAYAASLRAAPAVASVAEVKPGTLQVTAATADFRFSSIAALPVPPGATVAWNAPLRVAFSGGAPSDAAVASLANLSGVLEAGREGGAVVVYGVSEVVNPDLVANALAAGGAKPTPSLVLKRWKLAGFEKSMGSLPMLRAPLATRGVLSVRADRANKIVALLVDSTFDDPALNAAWKEAYAEATPLP